MVAQLEEAPVVGLLPPPLPNHAFHVTEVIGTTPAWLFVL